MKKIFALVLAVGLCFGMLFMTSCSNESKLDGIPYSSRFYEDYQTDAFGYHDDFEAYLCSFDYKNNEIVDIYIDTDYHVVWRAKSSTSGSTSDVEQVTSVPSPSQKEPQNSNNQAQPAQTTISVKEILQNSENYIVIATDDTVTLVPKTVAEFVVSTESNLLILEKTDSKITKATFCVTQEMLESIQ